MTAPQSVFENSPMKAVGQPAAAELALLEPFRGKVPDEVFGEPYVPPVTDGSGHDRRWLRRGAQLLTAAGCALKNGKRVMPDGAPITIEFLIDEPTFKPHHLPYIRNLATLGIDASLRIVDPVAIPAPARRLRFRHHGRALQLLRDAGRFAAQPIFPRRRRRPRARRTSPASPIRSIDALIDAVIAAKTREELDRGLPRARPRLPRRALLDPALVQSVALDRLLGRVRLSGAQAALFPRHSGDLVVRPGQGGEAATRRLVGRHGRAWFSAVDAFMSPPEAVTWMLAS